MGIGIDVDMVTYFLYCMNMGRYLGLGTWDMRLGTGTGIGG